MLFVDVDDDTRLARRLVLHTLHCPYVKPLVFLICVCMQQLIDVKIDPQDQERSRGEEEGCAACPGAV